MAAQHVILITGGNRGIGFELARQLLAEGSNHVIIGARSTEKGETAAKELKALNLAGSVDTVELDVTNKDTITAAAQKIEKTHQRLDALVNNAAVGDLSAKPLEVQMLESFTANSVGPLLVVEAFAPLLRKSATTARIVNVSSGAGSISLRLDASSPTHDQKEYAYRTSKTALNMITVCQSVEYGKEGMKVFAYCPGFTASGLSAMNTVEMGAKPTNEGARPIVAILSGERDGEHGCFLKEGGQWGW